MTDAQRRRDAALRRLRLANRGGVAASVAGAVVVMGLAHQATPVGTHRRAATELITRSAQTSDSVTRPLTPRHTNLEHKITPAAAPTPVISSQHRAAVATTPAVTSSTVATTTVQQASATTVDSPGVTPASTATVPVTSGQS